MSSKKKQDSKKEDKKVEKEIPASSAAAVAGFLVKQYPREAMKIVAGMESAATAKSMKRRMGKIKNAVASASASASASAAA